MGKSLQDQLLALGLASNNRKKGPGKRRQKPAGAGSTPSKPGDTGPAEVSLEQAWAMKHREEKKQADMLRRKKLAEQQKRRQINNEIRKIVDEHRLNRDEAELPRNFMFRGRIRKIYVSPDQRKALNAGEMGIVYLSGGYHLLAAEQVDAVRRLSAEHVADLGGVDEDDGDHPVPDDISW